MAAIHFRTNPDNPQARHIAHIAEILRKDGVIIYPTDTVYGLGCDIYNTKAIEKICRIKGVKSDKTLFSFICSDLTNISNYARVDNPVFKMLKRNLPGPFTFILNATSEVPKILKKKKKTIGIRIPENNITKAIVQELGNPIITTSLKIEDDVLEYPTDPEEIYDQYEKLVDAVVNGGYGNNDASTVVDCTSDYIEIIREGIGELEY